MQDLKFGFQLTPRSFRFTGFVTLLMVIALFALPAFMADTLSPKRAESHIRSYLERHFMGIEMEKLAQKGATIPDMETAQYWKNEMNAIQAMPFESIEVKHFLFKMPGSSRRLFAVKAVMGKPNGGTEVRYFSLGSENAIGDFFWVNEKSRWYWTFSF